MRRAFLFLPLALVVGCGSSPPDPAASAPKADYLTVPAAQLARLHVAPVATVPWPTVVHTTGTVDFDADRTTQAITQVSGPVKRIVVDTGAQVKAGDPLLYVASADVANAISAYRKAKNRLDLAQRELDRNKDLLAHKAIAVRDLESSQADYNDAATDLQASLEALKVFDLTEEDVSAAQAQNTTIQPELAMRAPIAGTVVQKLVLPGQVIEAGTTIAFVISDLSTVWVQGNVYENDLGSVRLGDAVDVQTPALPQVFHGTVSYIGAMVDPATRTTLVRITTTNPGRALKKDQFVDLTVHHGAVRQVLAVPSAAVLRDEQNMPFVYLQVGEGKFAQRHVTIGDQQGDQIEIRDGLKSGDPVVAEGSLFLQFASTYQQ
jgi:cobalt-zinc-cadmium efflux system membrane fusion protein